MGVTPRSTSPSRRLRRYRVSIPAPTAENVDRQPGLRDKGRSPQVGSACEIQPVMPTSPDSLGLKQVAEGTLVRGTSAKAGRQGRHPVTVTSSPRSTAAPGRGCHGTRPHHRSARAGQRREADVLTRARTRSSRSRSAELPPIERQARATAEERKGGEQGYRRVELGLSVAPANSVARAGGEGVVVTEVDPKSAAAERGLPTAGDIILRSPAGGGRRRRGARGYLRRPLDDKRTVLHAREVGRVHRASWRCRSAKRLNRRTDGAMRRGFGMRRQSSAPSAAATRGAGPRNSSPLIRRTGSVRLDTENRWAPASVRTRSRSIGGGEVPLSPPHFRFTPSRPAALHVQGGRAMVRESIPVTAIGPALANAPSDHRRRPRVRRLSGQGVP